MLNSNLLPIDLAVAEVMNRWPQTIQVLLRYHVGCIGCTMAGFDTISDVIRIYNLPKERFISDLYAAIESNQAH